MVASYSNGFYGYCCIPGKIEPYWLKISKILLSLKWGRNFACGPWCILIFIDMACCNDYRCTWPWFDLLFSLNQFSLPWFRLFSISLYLICLLHFIISVTLALILPVVWIVSAYFSLIVTVSVYLALIWSYLDWISIPCLYLTCYMEISLSFSWFSHLFDLFQICLLNAMYHYLLLWFVDCLESLSLAHSKVCSYI